MTARMAARARGSEEEAPSRTIAVSTPIGHRHVTPTPASPYVTDSHSANASAACLVAE